MYAGRPDKTIEISALGGRNLKVPLKSILRRPSQNTISNCRTNQSSSNSTVNKSVKTHTKNKQSDPLWKMERQISLPETTNEAEVTKNPSIVTFILFRPSSIFRDDDGMEGHDFREEVFLKSHGKWCMKKISLRKLHRLEFEQLAEPSIYNDFP